MKKQSLKAISLIMALLLLLSLSSVMAEKKADKKEEPEKLPAISATTVSDASILSGPRADAAFVAGIMADTKLNVLELGLSWSKVDAGLAQGYIASHFLKFSDVAEDKTFAVVSAPNGRLTLRSKPSTKAKALAKLNNGTVTATIEEDSEDNFTKVAVNGKEGYLLTKHLDFCSAKESVGTGVIIHPDHPKDTRKIRMRWSDKTGENIIESIKTGTPVVIISRDDNWYNIETMGKVGFMMKKYIEEDEAVASPAQPAIPQAPAQPAAVPQAPAQPAAVPQATVAPVQPAAPAAPVQPFVPSPTASPDPNSEYVNPDELVGLPDEE